MRNKGLALLFTLFLSLVGHLGAQEAFDFLKTNTPDFSGFAPSIERAPVVQNEPVTVKLVAEPKTVKPGSPFWVALLVDLDPGWHTYWKNPGDNGMATSIDWQLPKGLTITDVRWPTPERFEDNGMVSLGYDNHFAILVQLTPDQSLPARRGLEFAAVLRWVACNDGNCIPGDCDCSLNVTTAVSVPVANAEHRSLFAEARRLVPVRDWDAEATAEVTGIALTLTPTEPLDVPVDKAYFYPEQPNIIDHRAKLDVEEDDGQYQVTLITEESANPSVVKGALDLQDRSGNTVASVAVNSSVTGTPIAAADYADMETYSESDFEGGLGLALVLAFVGGMILNLMPCVLPVISLKILSIVKMAGQDRSETIKHGLMFSLGVLASFWALAGALLMLQAYGHHVGWGFQLQEPIFVALLAAVILIFSLSLFGVFELGTGVASWAGQQESNTTKQAHGLSSSFFNGILATAVATPCTGPFLGSAIGFAVTLPPASAMLVFTFLGAGMAFPYLFLTAFPSLTRWLPKPGNWMVTFKQLMGFLLLGTILWLVWVFSAQTESLGVFLLLCGLFTLSFACWIYGRWSNITRTRSARVGGIVGSTVFALLGSYLLVISAQVIPPQSSMPIESEDMVTQAIEDPNTWLPFSPKLIAKYRDEGRPVFVDFTAKWCVICQTNHYVLVTDDVANNMREKGVIKFKADWTRPDPAITKELRKYGRSGVPLYLLYEPGASKPKILPQVLTPDLVNSYLDDMGN